MFAKLYSSSSSSSSFAFLPSGSPELLMAKGVTENAENSLFLYVIKTVLYTYQTQHMTSL